MALLRQGALELGLELSDAQLAQFQLYYHELVRWNDRFNLTAITGYADVQTKHFLDSLAALPLAAQELGESLPPTRPLHLVDVGSGAGFPGIPLKIVAPRLKVTLMDGTGKKVRFLGELISTLGLNNAGVVHGRGGVGAHHGASRPVRPGGGAGCSAPQHACRIPAPSRAARRPRRRL